MPRYDSILGTFKAECKVVGDRSFSVGGHVIEVVSSRDPLQVKGGACGLDFIRGRD